MLLHTELEAQTGIAEKTLAEFVVDVAKGARNVDGFKKVGVKQPSRRHVPQQLTSAVDCSSSVL